LHTKSRFAQKIFPDNFFKYSW